MAIQAVNNYSANYLSKANNVSNVNFRGIGGKMGDAILSTGGKYLDGGTNVELSKKAADTIYKFSHDMIQAFTSYFDKNTTKSVQRQGGAAKKIKNFFAPRNCAQDTIKIGCDKDGELTYQRQTKCLWRGSYPVKTYKYDIERAPKFKTPEDVTTFFEECDQKSLEKKGDAFNLFGRVRKWIQYGENPNA